MPAKKLILTASIMVLAMITVLLFPRDESISVSIPLPIERTVEQLSKSTQVKNWFKPFGTVDNDSLAAMGNKWKMNAGNQQLELLSANSFSVILGLTSEMAKANLFYRIGMDSNYSDQSKVTLSYKKNLWGNFNGRNKLLQQAADNLRSLEAFTSNNIRFYGLDIRHKQVTDSAYLYMQNTVKNGQLKKAINELYGELEAFAVNRKLIRSGSRIINILPQKNDSVRISVGISISTYLHLPTDSKITYRTMPYGKKLLEAPFKGRYADLPKAFRSLEQYGRDHQLTTMAIPYGKYLDDRLDNEEGDIIDMLVYYPVD